MEIDKAGLAKLRVPYADDQISIFCKVAKKDMGNPKASCKKCGGYHASPSFPLSYVGHAATRNRLLDADPAWNWEPLSVDANGLPLLDAIGGLWIKLTVCGVTRLGYGNAEDKKEGKEGDAIKELIGDALRNASMSFGNALELWAKSELKSLNDDEEPETKPSAKPRPAPALKPVQAPQANHPISTNPGQAQAQGPQTNPGQAQAQAPAPELKTIDVDRWNEILGLNEANLKSGVTKLDAFISTASARGFKLTDSQRRQVTALCAHAPAPAPAPKQAQGE